MKPQELKYRNLSKILSKYIQEGRGEHIAFLQWFLESIFRLDAMDAQDAICDKANDKGVDGIYVDNNTEEIIVFQSKLVQNDNKTLGDAALRDLQGTLSQFETAEKVQQLVEGGGNPDLKKILSRLRIGELIKNGYCVYGVFVTNAPIDANGQEFADQADDLRVFDRNKIAAEFIDIDADDGVKGDFSFDASYVDPMKFYVGDRATTYIFLAKASELVQMDGIDDGTLFSQNVRLSLGNTKVNRSLRDFVENQQEHSNFPLYHNGVIILCKNAELSNGKLNITDYVVVNGAQSLSTFRKSDSCLSDDLRVLAKVVEISDDQLARKITTNSNNQNSIKPRDLKSNNEIQLRLKKEFGEVQNGKFEFEIKRGQQSKAGATVITNEEAGRLLLASDLDEPYSCHQVYKLFDEKYADIFGRPAVTAWRIALIYLIMQKIYSATENIRYKPLAKYGLTRFFLLSVVFQICRSDPVANSILLSPRSLFENGDELIFCDCIEKVLEGIIIDLDYEVEEQLESFDYKGDLKSPGKVRELRNLLLRSYEKDVKKKKAETIGDLFKGSKA